MLKWLVVGAAVVAAVGCGKDSPTSSSSNATTVSIVVNSQNLTTTAYNPNPISITRGSSIKWVNNDTIAHSSTSNTGVWESGLLGAGQSFTMTFPNAGSFPYHCSVHPNMIGTVNVQ